MPNQISSAPECFAAVLASSREGSGHLGVPEKSFHDLDWAILTDSIAGEVAGEDARALSRSLGLIETAHVERRRGEVFELQEHIAAGGRVPIGEPPALATPLLRARKLEAAEPEDLLLIANSLKVSSAVKRFFDHRAEELPLLEEHARRLSLHNELASDISGTFDAAGKIKDEASRELARLRRRSRSIRDTIQERLERYLRDPRFEGILQDDFVTLRDERFVVPVKSGERGDMPGIVHGHSGSGATLYVEPEDLISLNNELQMARTDVRREEHRILAELTTRVKAVADDVDRNSDILAYLDLTNACAIICNKMRATLPRVKNRSDDFFLREARHPLLALREERGELDVVANDIRFAGASRSLIISGPNTGGKTVSLKTVGMFGLMTRAGLPVPCHPDSTMPLFDRIFTDIGDEQTVQGDLSTFSAHVSNIASFVDRIVPGTLVLLDELFAGTDPRQATTLGRALLLEIDRLGGWSIVTTHLEGLKSLAFEDDKFSCASMGFDIEALAPTYQLRDGLPGSSYAHRIAARLGLPSRIVDQATSLADTETEVEAESLLQKLEEAHERILKERERAEVLRRELERERETLATEIEKARAQEDAILSEATRDLKEQIRTLKARLEEAFDRLRTVNEQSDEELSEGAQKSLEEARRIAEEVQRRTSREIRVEREGSNRGEGEAADDGRQLSQGDRVWVSSFKQHGVVAEEPRDGEKVTVQIGAVRVSVGREVLRESEEQNARPVGTLTRGPSTGRSAISERIDLRGMRVDEALERLHAHVEEAVMASVGSLTFIHGHGTGALKRAIRAELSRISYELRFRPGARSEGGDGVTVVELDSSE